MGTALATALVRGDAPGGGGTMGFGLHHRSSGTWVVRWLDGQSSPVTLTPTLTLSVTLTSTLTLTLTLSR